MGHSATLVFTITPPATTSIANVATPSAYDASGGSSVTLPAASPSTLPTDFSGIGQSDLAIYLPSFGAFAIRPPSGPDVVVPFGFAGAGQTLPAPGDYDGDGKADIAAYLPSIGAFAIRPSSGGSDEILPFGIAGAGQSIPMPGDYDGSGKTELAVYLPSLGAVAYRPAHGGPDVIESFGLSGAGQSIPAPGDYDGSGKTELAVYLPSLGAFAYRPAHGGPDVIEPFGLSGTGQSIPVTATDPGATSLYNSAAVSTETLATAGVTKAVRSTITIRATRMQEAGGKTASIPWFLNPRD